MFIEYVTFWCNDCIHNKNYRKVIEGKGENEEALSLENISTFHNESRKWPSKNSRPQVSISKTCRGHSIVDNMQMTFPIVFKDIVHQLFEHTIIKNLNTINNSVLFTY